MKYGVKCHRSAASRFGEAIRWAKFRGHDDVKLFDSMSDAREEAKRLTEWNTSENCSYWAEEYSE